MHAATQYFIKFISYKYNKNAETREVFRHSLALRNIDTSDTSVHAQTTNSGTDNYTKNN